MNPKLSRTGPLVGVSIGVGAIIAFFLPGGTFFGVLLLLLCGVYVACVVTGMNPNAGLGDTASHVTRVATAARPANRTPSTPGNPGGPTWSPVLGQRGPAVPPTAPPPMAGPYATPPVAPDAPSTPSVDQQTPPSMPASTDTTPPPPAAAAAPLLVPDPAGESVAPATVSLIKGSTQTPPPPATEPISPQQPPLPHPAFMPPADVAAPTPTGPNRSRTPLLAVALTMVLVLVVGAAAFAGWRLWSSHSDGPSAPVGFAAGMTHRSFPAVPSAAFAISPQQLNTQVFTRPNYLVGGEESVGVLRSSRYLITGFGQGDLVAVDPRDGRIAWQQSGFRGLTCSDVFDDNTIGCAADDGGLVFLSEDDGSVISRPPGGYQRVQKFRDKYAYAKTDGDTATVSLGTRDNPTAYWTRSQTIPGGTRTFLEVSDGIIDYADGSLSGGWSLAYTASGEKAAQITRFGTLLDRDKFTNAPGDAALVYDDSGRQIYMASSPPRQPRLYAPAPNVSIAFTRDSAIDPSTGRTLWPRPLTPDPTSQYDDGLVAVVGTVAILQSDNGSNSVGVDVRSGRTLWTNPVDGFAYQLATDGRRVFGVTEDSGVSRLTAIDVATGEMSYSVTLPDLGSYPQVAAVGDDLVVVGTTAILGFHPTGGAAQLYDGTTTSASNQGGGVTRCSTPPTVRPVNFAVDNQNLLVRLEFTAGCGDGDVLSNSRYEVSVRDQNSIIASSTFDLSSTPIAVAGGGNTQRDFAFPAGTYFRLPSSLAGGSGSSTSVSASSETVQCTGEGTDSVAPGQRYTSTSGSDAAPVVGADQASPTPGLDTTTNAIDALRAQADADRPLVQSQYLDRWLAQISAKQVRTPPMMATDVDDRTMVAWTPEQILRQHLDLRARYPEVRLLYSDEWRTFDLRGWWITVAQPNVLDAAGANGWCDSKAIAPNQCFAKLVSNNRGSEGTTAYRR